MSDVVVERMRGMFTGELNSAGCRTTDSNFIEGIEKHRTAVAATRPRKPTWRIVIEEPSFVDWLSLLLLEIECLANACVTHKTLRQATLCN